MKLKNKLRELIDNRNLHNKKVEIPVEEEGKYD